MIACSSNKPEVIKKLLANGVKNINVQNNYARRTLDYAKDKCDRGIVDLLIAYGAKNSFDDFK